MMKSKETHTLKEYGRKADEGWTDVMEQARAKGFTLMSSDGTAMLATHKNQLDSYGLPEYLRIQKVNGHCPKTFGYDCCIDKSGEQIGCEACAIFKKGA